jgi:hypothetical protein
MFYDIAHRLSLIVRINIFLLIYYNQYEIKNKIKEKKFHCIGKLKIYDLKCHHEDASVFVPEGPVLCLENNKDPKRGIDFGPLYKQRGLNI